MVIPLFVDAYWQDSLSIEWIDLLATLVEETKGGNRSGTICLDCYSVTSPVATGLASMDRQDSCRTSSFFYIVQ